MTCIEFVKAIDNLDDDPAFIEKCLLDDEGLVLNHTKRNAQKKRDNAWQRKRSYKKKLVRRFLSINPSMDYSDSWGMRCSQAIYLHFPQDDNGEYVDHRMNYCINPYTKVFLSRRGDLRVYHGNISYIRGNFTLANKDKMIQRITNKRIRKASASENTIYTFSYQKKLHGPRVDDLW